VSRFTGALLRALLLLPALTCWFYFAHLAAAFPVAVRAQLPEFLGWAALYPSDDGAQAPGADLRSAFPALRETAPESPMRGRALAAPAGVEVFTWAAGLPERDAVRAQPWPELRPDLYFATELGAFVARLLAALSLATVGLLLLLQVAAEATARSRELGLLRSLGAADARIRRRFLLPSLLGLFLAVLLAAALVALLSRLPVPEFLFYSLSGGLPVSPGLSLPWSGTGLGFRTAFILIGYAAAQPLAYRAALRTPIRDLARVTTGTAS